MRGRKLRQAHGAAPLLHQSSPYDLSGLAGSGYVAPVWGALAHYQRFAYDELGNQTLNETKSQGGVLWSSSALYDGWQRQATDANGRRTDFEENAFGQLVKVTEYNVGNIAQVTTYAYDLRGGLTGVTDALGSVTSMSYDLLGRKTAMSDPDMGSWVYQYDANGNLSGQRDARNPSAGSGQGLWLYLGYDDLNRLVSKRQDNPTTGALVAEYFYDAVGQKGLLSKSRGYNAEGVVEVENLAYDARNRPTQQQWLVPGSGGGSFRMAATFDEADRKTSLTYPGGDAGQLGEVVSYGYNAVGQLTGVSGLGGIQYVSAASYNAQGQLTQLVNENPSAGSGQAGANGLTRQWSYETNTLRLSVVRAGVAAPFESLQKLSYGYDNVGNVATLTDGTNSNQAQSFGYDWLNRLTSASTNAAGVGQYSHSYSYDAVGNITSYAGAAYTYGDPAHKHAVTAAFGNTYGYDANGNQTSRTIGGVSYTFAYDYENRLTSIAGSGLTATFLYDADGQRVKGTVNGVITTYVAGVYEWQGGATTLYYEGNAIRRSGYATDNGIFYLLQDHLKSSSAFVTQGGVVNSRNYFYPFGGNRGGTAFSSLATKRFTGQYHEAGLPGGEGLSYYGARWYDARLGRFLSADTIVPNPSNPQDLNRYSYVLNNPPQYRDPNGHCPLCFVVGFVAAFILGGDSTQHTAAYSLVATHRTQILQIAARRKVNPVMLGAIVDHESNSFNRFGGWGDRAFSTVKRNNSIGVGQMQPSLARQLEEAGYMPKQPSEQARRAALLNDTQAIEYVGARLQHLGDQIDRWYAGRGVKLESDTRNRLIMLSYNQGWDDPNNSGDILDNLEKYSEREYRLSDLTVSLAYDGQLPDGTFINDYHISRMWKPKRVEFIEQLLGVKYDH